MPMARKGTSRPLCWMEELSYDRRATRAFSLHFRLSCDIIASTTQKRVVPATSYEDYKAPCQGFQPPGAVFMPLWLRPFRPGSVPE